MKPRSQSLSPPFLVSLASSVFIHLSPIARALLLFSEQAKNTPSLMSLYQLFSFWVPTLPPRFLPDFVNKESLIGVFRETFPNYPPWKPCLSISYPPSFFTSIIISKYDWCILWNDSWRLETLNEYIITAPISSSLSFRAGSSAEEVYGWPNVIQTIQ